MIKPHIVRIRLVEVFARSAKDKIFVQSALLGIFKMEMEFVSLNNVHLIVWNAKIRNPVEDVKYNII